MLLENVSANPTRTRRAAPEGKRRKIQFGLHFSQLLEPHRSQVMKSLGVSSLENHKRKWEIKRKENASI
jgi:hypothetical protein